MEIAARSCFAYNNNNSTTDDDDPTTNSSTQPQQQQQSGCAAAMAQRYLVSKQGNTQRALQKMKATLQFRRDNAVDTVFKTALLHEQQHDTTPLYNMLASTKKLYVAGRDREGRSTYVFVPRRVVDHDLHLTRKAHLWTLEKAIACTRSDDGTINAMVDFADFDAIRQAPPIANGKDILTLLRDHYAGRVHRIYFVHTPRSFHWLWRLLAPFAGTATKKKIVFVSQSSQQQQQQLLNMYEPDQVPSWIEGGTWDDTFSIESFLRLPFDQLLGDGDDDDDDDDP